MSLVQRHPVFIEEPSRWLSLNIKGSEIVLDYSALVDQIELSSTVDKGPESYRSAPGVDQHVYCNPPLLSSCVQP